MPRWWFSRLSTLTPLPSIAARTEPADVPTITSASRGSQSSASRNADSAPIIQAAPSTPPPPSTRPRRGAVGAHRAVSSSSASDSSMQPARTSMSGMESRSQFMP